jgi:hypothetical protein
MKAKEASMEVTSRRTAAAADEMATVFDFFNTYREGRSPENVKAHLTFGNPHEMPLKGLVTALDKATEGWSSDSDLRPPASRF